MENQKDAAHFQIAIVTPVFNGAVHLRATMESVLTQAGEFDLHYHVQDGGSTDGTLKILREFERRIADGEFATLRPHTRFTWKSEADTGMYDAIQRGFVSTRADVLAWLNSDDLYLPGALEAVAHIFRHLPEVEWLKGVTGYIDEESRVLGEGRCYFYDRQWIARGVYGLAAHFIQQDSVFWRRSLWDRAGGLPSGFRLAGDYALWIRFAAHAELFTFPESVSRFRRVAGQLSQNADRYRAEALRAIPAGVPPPKWIKFFFKVARRLPIPIAQLVYCGLLRPTVGLIEDRDGLPTIRRVRRFEMRFTKDASRRLSKVRPRNRD